MATLLLIEYTYYTTWLVGFQVRFYTMTIDKEYLSFYNTYKPT